MLNIDGDLEKNGYKGIQKYWKDNIYFKNATARGTYILSGTVSSVDIYNDDVRYVDYIQFILALNPRQRGGKRV